MVSRSIYITRSDVRRLRDLLAEARHTEYRGSEYLDNLEAELERGKVVPTREVPPDVITMNSQVRLQDLETGEEIVYTLVFPEDADLSAGKVSVLAPMGTALLGYRVGATIEWQAPAGTQRMRVVELLHQPESAGDHHL